LNSEELYSFSLDFNEFVKSSRQLDAFHWYRYKYFVDNSNFDDPKKECRYVIKTKQLGEDQKSQLKQELKTCKDLLESLLERIEDE